MQGKFKLTPKVLGSTYAVGYDSIGDYVNDISKNFAGNESDDESMSEVPIDDRKAWRKSDIKLLIGSSIVSEIRAAVKAQTGYECSAGIAHNRILAKLVCGINKPNKQTILPLKSVKELYRSLPVRKVQGLGGKFGEEVCQNLKIEMVGELIRFSKDEMQRRFGERSG